MQAPKRIDEITIDDLRLCRWCYFQDDEGGFDAFEWVIPESHPKFSKDVIELELAIFRFQGGEEFEGMFEVLSVSLSSLVISGMRFGMEMFHPV